MQIILRPHIHPSSFANAASFSGRVETHPQFRCGTSRIPGRKASFPTQFGNSGDCCELRYSTKCLGTLERLRGYLYTTGANMFQNLVICIWCICFKKPGKTGNKDTTCYFVVWHRCFCWDQVQLFIQPKSDWKPTTPPKDDRPKEAKQKSKSSKTTFNN